MIPTTTMQLPKPETGDQMEPFFLGTQPDGGYWMTVTRLSEHDHTGGLLGKPITAATIPDGSITTSKLDPSVLAPYAPTDGSKPFTGQVTMQADAVVRDALFFGPQGSAAAPDASLVRTGAGALRLDTNLAVGVAPAAWHADLRVAQAGALGVVGGVAGGASPNTSQLLANSYYDSAFTLRAVLNNQPGAFLDLGGGKLAFYTMPSVAAGAAQASVKRLEVGPTGTLTLSPDAGVSGLTVTHPGGASLFVDAPAGTNSRVGAGGAGAALELYAATNVIPLGDNALPLGQPTRRWSVVYAANGTIQTSAAEAKQDITPLDPAAALAAVLATDPVTFTYTAPAPTAAQYELPDDPEQAEQVLYDRLVNAPLMEAARSQAGFVLASPDYATDPLFETGAGQSNAANTAGVLLAAVKALATRVTALEGS